MFTEVRTFYKLLLYRPWTMFYYGRYMMQYYVIYGRS